MSAPEPRHRTARPAAGALLAALAVLALTLGAAPAPAQTPASTALRATNPLPAQRTDEVVSVAWAEVLRALPGAAPGRISVLDAAAGAELVSQVVDGDGDGTPDELLFLASFWPRQTRELRLEAAAPATDHPRRAFARHDPPRDDVAWETDRIGFRMYGRGLWNASGYEPLVSSGLDVWPKRVRDLIVERWYEKGHDAYHLDTGEGADFYTVGRSLGAGGSAVWRDGRLHHAGNFAAHRILASGPIRTVFELRYEPWDAGGITVTEVKRISMDAGQNLFRQEIVYGAPGAEEITYAVGTVKREGLVGSGRRSGNWAWTATWGPVERKNGGHGELGTAILMRGERLLERRETEDHYLAIAAARPGVPAVQWVGAGWTASGDFPDVAAWWRYLDDFAQRLEHPIEVELRRR